MNLAEKVVVVTGGVRGIGLGLVQFLAERGAKLAVLDRDVAGLVALKDSMPDIWTGDCELSDPESVAVAVDAIYESFGAIHGLVNNAGFIYSQPLFSLLAKGEKKHGLEMWRKVLDDNLTSVFVATSHVVEKMAMRRTKGVIVNISSIAAQGNIGQTAYSAAKAGVNAMTVTWAKELGMLGIRCVAIAPGFVDTDSTREALAENVLNEWVRRTPLRRLGQVEQIAEAVLFAIENDFVSGVVLPIDGGLTL